MSQYIVCCFKSGGCQIQKTDFSHDTKQALRGFCSSLHDHTLIEEMFESKETGIEFAKELFHDKFKQHNLKLKKQIKISCGMKDCTAVMNIYYGDPSNVRLQGKVMRIKVPKMISLQSHYS